MLSREGLGIDGCASPVNIPVQGAPRCQALPANLLVSSAGSRGLPRALSPAPSCSLFDVPLGFTQNMSLSSFAHVCR